MGGKCKYGTTNQFHSFTRAHAVNMLNGSVATIMNAIKTALNGRIKTASQKVYFLSLMPSLPARSYRRKEPPRSPRGKQDCLHRHICELPVFWLSHFWHARWFQPQ